MTRAVVDTNVFVSAVLGQALAVIIDLWRAGDFQLVVTDEVVAEYLEVLQRPKFGLPADAVDDILAYVLHRAVFVVPVRHAHVVKNDPSDDKFLDAAIAGDADVIVSGDQHLLSLGRYEGVPVIGAREFIDLLQKPRLL